MSYGSVRKLKGCKRVFIPFLGKFYTRFFPSAVVPFGVFFFNHRNHRAIRSSFSQELARQMATSAERLEIPRAGERRGWLRHSVVSSVQKPFGGLHTLFGTKPF